MALTINNVSDIDKLVLANMHSTASLLQVFHAVVMTERIGWIKHLVRKHFGVIVRVGQDLYTDVFEELCQASNSAISDYLALFVYRPIYSSEKLNDIEYKHLVAHMGNDATLLVLVYHNQTNRLKYHLKTYTPREEHLRHALYAAADSLAYEDIVDVLSKTIARYGQEQPKLDLVSTEEFEACIYNFGSFTWDLLNTATA